jgi:hypothetical protein
MKTMLVDDNEDSVSNFRHQSDDTGLHIRSKIEMINEVQDDRKGLIL